ncbi:MAG TPA: hypothetical protein VFE59_17090, partial [Trebonia sp.]|nr:hypothetical protein [Trebonia sp.]
VRVLVVRAVPGALDHGRHRSGEDMLPDEARGECGDLIGALRVRIVPAPLDHRDGAESGGHRGDDSLGLGPGVGPVGVLVPMMTRAGQEMRGSAAPASAGDVFRVLRVVARGPGPRITVIR